MHLLSFSFIIMLAGSLVVTQIAQRNSATPVISSAISDTPSVHESKGLYCFDQPDRIYILPAILQEISGIALADASTMYCIQDENGIVYKYDLQKGEIIDDIPFGEPGDYEDLTIVNGDIFVLRSDAKVFRVNPKKSPSLNSYQIPVSCTEVEGMYYSASDELMYVACKSSVAKGPEGSRSVYQFSLTDINRLTPSIVIEQEDIPKVLPGDSGKSKKQKMSFNPSAIAVHPLTHDLYVLSASQQFVGVFSKGVLKHLFPLPAEVYYQPEGIAFSANGDMYLSSEGSKDGKHNAGIYFLRQH